MTQNDDDDCVSYHPGLHEEILLEMRRKRHAYGHEVVALVDEVLQLRAQRNAGVVNTDGSRRSVAMDIAERLHGGFLWSSTPQGQAYWTEVYNNLRNLT